MIRPIVVIATLVAALAMLSPALPAEAAAAKKYSVTISVLLGSDSPGYRRLWTYIRRAGTGKPLRYIPVCLQRRDNGSWNTRSCHKTMEIGRSDWRLYAGKTYRLYVPATAYHYARYSSSFRS